MRTKKLTTKKFLFAEGDYVIAHLSSSLFIIKTVPDRVTAMNMITYSRGWWVACGYGQDGWTTAIERIAFELHEQAQICSKREAHDARQFELFGRPEDQRTAKAVASLKEELEGPK